MNINKLRTSMNAHVASPLAIMKYDSVVGPVCAPGWGTHFVAIPCSEVNRPVMNALTYARLLGGQTVAVHVLLDSSRRDDIEGQWKMNNIDIPLMILESSNDSVLEPITKFVDDVLHRHKKSVVTVLLPVLAGLKWWQRFLHNQTARLIEKAFQGKADVVTIRVPFFLTRCPQNELQSSGKGI